MAFSPMHHWTDQVRALLGLTVREGARQRLAEALPAEVDAYVAPFAEERSHLLVVRNGHHGHLVERHDQPAT